MPLNYISRSVDFARCRCDIDLRGALVVSGGRRSTDSRPASDEEVEIADNWSTASQISEDPSSSIPEEGTFSHY